MFDLQINEDLLTLLRYWDASGEWQKWGLFEDNADGELVVKALASAWIYVQNTEPEITKQHFGAILENAGEWNGFYSSIRNMAREILPKRFPEAGKFTFIFSVSKCTFRYRREDYRDVARYYDFDGELR